MRQLLIYISISLSVLTLSACSVFSPIKAESHTTYLISALPAPDLAPARRGGNILVTLPETPPIYNTTAMAYTTQPYQLAYFVKNSWAETPPQMLQPLIVQTLQQTQHFHSVGALSALGAYNYILNTQLLELKQDFSQTPNRVHVVLRAQLIRAAENELVASKTFVVDHVILKSDPYSGVRATNEAIAIILAELADFCLDEID